MDAPLRRVRQEGSEVTPPAHSVGGPDVEDITRLLGVPDEAFSTLPKGAPGVCSDPSRAPDMRIASCFRLGNLEVGNNRASGDQCIM